MNFFRDFEEQMNEEFFAETQKLCPWFNGELLLNEVPDLEYKDLKDIKTLEDIFDKDIDFFDAKRIVFAKIFGTSGFPINLSEAEQISLDLIYCFEKLRPKKIDLEKEDDLECVYEYAAAHILLGTVYAYKKEYVKASYHFIVGLKEKVVNLSMPYCDFINYIILKLKDLKKENANYKGTGFSSEDFMGFPIQKNDNKFLMGEAGKTFIPTMRGKNGEEIIAHSGRAKFYGFLDRRGSARNNDVGANIDIYHTLVIDKNYNLKEVVFYFNNYITHGCKQEDLVPAEGFEFVLL